MPAASARRRPCPPRRGAHAPGGGRVECGHSRDVHSAEPPDGEHACTQTQCRRAGWWCRGGGGPLSGLRTFYAHPPRPKMGGAAGWRLEKRELHRLPHTDLGSISVISPQVDVQAGRESDRQQQVNHSAHSICNSVACFVQIISDRYGRSFHLPTAGPDALICQLTS